MDLKTAYEILKVNAKTPFKMVTKVYHKLALKMHPDKNKAPNAEEKFTQLQKAYEFIKKNGENSDSGSLDKDGNQPETPQQPEPNEFDINLTLEEIFAGCKRTEPISIKVVDANGRETKKSKKLNVNVNKGAIGGSRITLKEMGDEFPGKIPANVVFIVRELPHEHFKRTRFDLEYTAKLTTEQACSRKVKVPLIENPNKKILMTINQVITQSTVERVKGKGMPIPTDVAKRGDLVIRFDIIYEKDKKQDPPVEYDIELTLEQILKGANKRMKIKRKVVDAFEGKHKTEDKVFRVKIPAGVATGEKFIFEKEGDQSPETIPADVIFTVKQAQHPHFTRKDADIQCTVLLSETEKRNGCSLQIPTLDGEPIIEEVTKDSFVSSKKFPGKGLPIPNSKPAERGNLEVKFKVLADKFVDQTIERDLPLTLKNILKGCTKNLKMSRLIKGLDGKETIEEKTLTVEVKPGTEAGTRFPFVHLGDQLPGRIPADIVFIATDKEDKNFKRNKGVNVEYTVKLTADELKKGGSVDIPTLEGNTVKVSLDDVVKFNAVKKFPKLGLPHPDDPDKRGNLLVRIVDADAEEHKEAQKSEKKQTSKPKAARSEQSKERPKAGHGDDLEQDPEIVQNIKLTKEQLQKGVTKKVKITRTIQELNGNEQTEEKMLKIIIEPGEKVGKRHVFKQEGDQNPGRIPANIVFVTVLKPSAKPESSNAFKPKPGPSRALFKDPPVEQDLPLTLENILNGCTKRMKIKRIIVDDNGNETVQDKIIAIDIKPGIKAGTRFSFEEMGDKRPGSIPADIVFVARDKPHPTFVRKGADIEHTVKYDSSKSFETLQIPTLEKEDIPILMTVMNKHEKIRRIPERGLPKPNNVHQRGDLVVRLVGKDNSDSQSMAEFVFEEFS